MSNRGGGRGWGGGGGRGGGGGGGYNNGGGGRGGGGGGGWGGQGGRGGGGGGWTGQGNRFGALQQQPQDQQFQQQGGGGGGRGFGGGGGGARLQEPPDEAIRTDMQSEKPLWVLSCYGHARDGPNDLTGDVSFEEARWATMQDLRAGRTPLSINADFKNAVRAKQEEFTQLLARSRDRRGGPGAQLPSRGGPPIHVHNAWSAQFQGGPAPGAIAPGGFGAPSGGGGFGAPAPAAPQAPFGAQGGFGSAPMQQPPAASGFGAGVFGAGGGFGQQPSSGFGQSAPMAADVQPPAAVATAGAGFGVASAAVAPGATLFGQPLGTTGGGGFGAPAGGGGPFGTAAPAGAAAAKGSWTGQGGFGAAKPGPTQAPSMLFGQSVMPAPSGGVNLATGGGFVPSPAPGQPPAGVGGGFGAPALGFGSPAAFGTTAGFAPAPVAGTAAMAPEAAMNGGGDDAAAAGGGNRGGEGAGGGGGGGAAATAGGLGDEDIQAYRATAFTLGKIPELPPPPELCY